MQQWNEYRRRALGNYWQRNGVKVIPTLSWTDKRSFKFCFGSLPKKATYAVSTIGVKDNEEASEIYQMGITSAIKMLQPRRFLVYGGKSNFDYGNTEVIEYKANTAFKEK